MQQVFVRAMDLDDVEANAHGALCGLCKRIDHAGELVRAQRMWHVPIFSEGASAR